MNKQHNKKEEQAMHLFIKKIRQYPLYKRIGLSNYLQEEGEHGYSSVHVALYQLFFPGKKQGYSWKFMYQIGITDEDIEYQKRAKYVGSYASLYDQLPIEKQKIILKKLKEETLQDKIKNSLYKFINFIATDEKQR